MYRKNRRRPPGNKSAGRTRKIARGAKNYQIFRGCCFIMAIMYVYEVVIRIAVLVYVRVSCGADIYFSVEIRAL